MAKLLVVSVHPDDETLGCGGTLLKHKANGDEIHWLLITNISESHGWTSGEVENTQKEIVAVSEAYGFDSCHMLDYPSTELDTIPMREIMHRISKVIMTIQPSIIYLVNRSDIHTDHQIAFKAVIGCTKNFRYPFIRRILMYETLSETEFSPPLPGNAFQPNVFVDVSEFFEKKCEIMKYYSGEVLDNPYPRSIESLEFLARHRGSRIGVNYAEAFMLILEVWKS